MAKKPTDESYSPKVAQERFEAALRGARVTGHKPMADIAGKRKRAAKKKRS